MTFTFCVLSYTHRQRSSAVRVFAVSFTQNQANVSKLSNTSQHTVNVSLNVSIIVVIIFLDLSFESIDLNI